MPCDVCNGTGVVWALFAGVTEEAVPCAACRAPAKPVADLLANLGTPDHIVAHTMAMEHKPGCGWEGDDSSVWTCVEGCPHAT